MAAQPLNIDAGSAIRAKFSLGGYQGLSIFCAATTADNHNYAQVATSWGTF